MAARREGASGDADEFSGLEDVVAQLRADVPVRREWRQDVLGEVGQLVRTGTQGPGRRTRGWTISPPTAIAAALAFTALGAAAAAGLYSIRDREARVASTPAAAAPTRAAGSTQQQIRFALVAPGATHVSLVGDFNRWDAKATPMRPLGDGRLWIVEVPLAPGRHVYAFVVDGDVTPDPAAPRAGEEDFGTPSSVVLVGARGS